MHLFQLVYSFNPVIAMICQQWYINMHFLILLLSFFAVEKEEWISPQTDSFDCHSSSIIQTAQGRYGVVWKWGAGVGKSNIEMEENVGIWLSFFDGTWSEPKEIVSAPRSVCWNPVLCRNLAGELLLFYRVGATPRCTVSFLKRSQDHGEHWSQEEILPTGIVGPTKNKPLFTLGGDLISPSSVEMGEPEDPLKATACWIEILEGGTHWKKIGPLELAERKFGVIEPALFFDKEGKLRMLCRDRARRVGGKGSIWMAISEDEGRHWSDLKQTDLPNPDSGLDVVDLGQGKLILLYNHSHTERYPLHLTVSLDGGDMWSKPLVLDEKGEVPSGILGKDGLVHITYARESGPDGQRRIKHIVVNPDRLIRINF